MAKNESNSFETGEIIVYNPDDSIHLEVRMERESVWLTQSQIGTLFGVDRTVIVKHIKNVYDSGELEEVTTCAKIAHVRQEGGRSVARTQKYYNLDMILSVGYRNSFLFFAKHFSQHITVRKTAKTKDYTIRLLKPIM